MSAQMPSDQRAKIAESMRESWRDGSLRRTYEIQRRTAEAVRSRAPFTLAERNAVITALRDNPGLSNAKHAARLNCSSVSIWTYRRKLDAYVAPASEEAPPVFHCFQCGCGAEVVVGPISARGPHKCSTCRTK